MNEILAPLDPQLLIVALWTKVHFEGLETIDEGMFLLSVAEAPTYIHLTDGRCFIARDSVSAAGTQTATRVMLDNGEFIEFPSGTRFAARKASPRCASGWSAASSSLA